MPSDGVAGAAQASDLCQEGQGAAGVLMGVADAGSAAASLVLMGIDGDGDTDAAVTIQARGHI